MPADGEGHAADGALGSPVRLALLRRPLFARPGRPRRGLLPLLRHRPAASRARADPGRRPHALDHLFGSLPPRGHPAPDVDEEQRLRFRGPRWVGPHRDGRRPPPLPCCVAPPVRSHEGRRRVASRRHASGRRSYCPQGRHGLHRRPLPHARAGRHRGRPPSASRHRACHRSVDRLRRRREPHGTCRPRPVADGVRPRAAPRLRVLVRSRRSGAPRGRPRHHARGVQPGDRARPAPPRPGGAPPPLRPAHLGRVPGVGPSPRLGSDCSRRLCVGGATRAPIGYPAGACVFGPSAGSLA